MELVRRTEIRKHYNLSWGIGALQEYGEIQVPNYLSETLVDPKSTQK